LGNKVFTFLHIEQKAAAGLGYTMAPENPLASPQTAQFMGADQNHHAAMRFAARRKHAGTRLPCVRVAPHSRPSEAPSYLLDK